MPYPSQVDRERIIHSARAMIERAGVDQLSLHTLAAELGVKAPSLYRYVENKMALLRAIIEATNTDLIATLYIALRPEDEPRAQLIAIARAYRAFVHRNPVAYGLAYTTTITELRTDPALLEAGVLPIQQIMARLSGEANSLPALRGVWALIHGWSVLEVGQQFQRGGDLDASFVRAVEAYLDGWQAG